MLLRFRICLFEEEGYTPAATMIGYDFRSVRRRRNQQPPQTDKVITTSASPRLLKPYILLKEQTRRSRKRRSPGASKGFEQPGRISSKDEDKKKQRSKQAVENHTIVSKKEKRTFKTLPKKAPKASQKLMCGRKRTTTNRAKLQIKQARET
jgi:hypothetical protein